MYAEIGDIHGSSGVAMFSCSNLRLPFKFHIDLAKRVRRESLSARLFQIFALSPRNCCVVAQEANCTSVRINENLSVLCLIRMK